MEQALSRVIGRARRRIRFQRALNAGTTVGVLSLLSATVLIYLLKTKIIDQHQLTTGLICAAALPLLAALASILRRVSILHVSKLIDQSHALHDRVGTAVEFCQTRDQTDFMRAQVAETMGHLPRVKASLAVPFRLPGDSRALGLLALCLGFMLIVRFPTTTPPIIKKVPVKKLSISPDDLEPHKAMAEQLRKDALAQDQEDVSRFAQELNKLFDEIEKKKLTRKELFAKLAELEKKYMEGLDGDFDDLLKKLKKMGGDLQKEKLTKDIGKALKKAKLAAAKKELEKLAEKMDKMSKKDRRKLARTLDRAARHKMDKDNLDKKINQLKKQIRRLQRKKKNQPKTAKQRRRLQRKRRQLQRLNKQQQRMAQRRRQLQRLNKQLQQAAAQMRNKLSPEARKALQKAAQQMGKFANQINKLRMLGKAQGQLVDLKELLRRLGKGGKGRRGRMKDFMVRAGGKKGKGKGKDGKGKKGKMGLMMDPSGKGGTLLLPLPGKQAGAGQGDPTGQPGDGIGSGSDPNVSGAKTSIRSKRKNIMVRGKQSKGPTRSEVILGASEKGFSTQSYKRVYRDYSQIVEDVLKREDVPLGYKYYVKRYFHLIKPR